MHTFKKEERLCNKRLITGLYHKGSSFLCYPFKVSWLAAAEPLPHPVQILFSVPKKRYKHAVDRNLIKRRMREAYRLHKQILLYDKLTAGNKQIILALSYVGKEIADYAFMEKKMLKMLSELCSQIDNEVGK